MLIAHAANTPWISLWRLHPCANHPINAALFASADAPNPDLLLHTNNLIEDLVLVFIEMKSSITGQIVSHLMAARGTLTHRLSRFCFWLNANLPVEALRSQREMTR